jgi:hypothetical protein
VTATLAAALVQRETSVAALALAGLAAHLLTAPSLRRGLLALAPVLAFASVLALIGRLGGSSGALVALKTLAVYTLAVSAARLARCEAILEAVNPGSRFFHAALFLLMVRHFAGVLGQESWRLLVAHRLAAPQRWRPGWLDSMAWAMAALLRRALVRAERFYAAQRVRGLAE